MVVIYNEEFAKLEFDESVPCITWTPVKFVTGEKWRQPFRMGMDYMEERIKEMPDLGWLNDTRSLKTVKMDDLRWLNENVNDRAYKFGAKKVAFVLPENIFGKLAVKFYVEYTTKRMDNKFQIKAFNTLEKAKEWLKAKSDIVIEEEAIL